MFAGRVVVVVVFTEVVVVVAAALVLRSEAISAIRKCKQGFVANFSSPARLPSAFHTWFALAQKRQWSAQIAVAAVPYACSLWPACVEENRRPNENHVPRERW